MSQELMIPAADTRLHTVDAPGGTPALLFLSGGFGTVENWSRVVERLAGRYRTVRFDARGRGKSDRSADYSVRAAVDDVGRVIDATGIERPILVGWSHGATIAVRYATQDPARVAGLVLIDGAFPIAMFDEAGKEKVRAQFRRLRWIMRILAAVGRSARMSPTESADVVIEMDAVNGALGPDFAKLECPTVFVVGTGGHPGATDEEMRTVRAAVTDAEQRNERVSVFATTPHKHTQILTKAPDTVVAAIEGVIRNCPSTARPLDASSSEARRVGRLGSSPHCGIPPRALTYRDPPRVFETALVNMTGSGT
jgi:pimeloyl-ACP methyl ester carboxylesterase